MTTAPPGTTELCARRSSFFTSAGDQASRVTVRSSRPTYGGNTWGVPELIATTARRPDVIREVKTFEVYPGMADVFPDDRVLVTWNYIADDKAKDGYYERACCSRLVPTEDELGASKA